MKKKYLALLLCVILCLCACSALAATSGKYYYDVENGGAVIISYGFDYDNPETTLDIPETLGGYPVTGIGYHAFEGCYWLEKVSLPKSIREIGWYAFSGCNSLKEIVIPDNSLTSIGRYAFKYCGSLKSIDLPDTLTIISGSAFEYCSSLTSIAIPFSVEKVDSFAFGGCSSLKSIIAYGSGTHFSPLTYHTEPFSCFGPQYSLPSSVTITCWKNSSAEDVALDRHFTIKYFKDSDNAPDFVYSIEDGQAIIQSYNFSTSNPETKLEIPATLDGYPVTEIGYAAFDGCSWLREVTLPESVRKIDWYAFAGCTELNKVRIPYYGLEFLGNGAFMSCTNLHSLNLPDSLTTIGSGAFMDCSSLTKMSIPAGVLKLNAFTFSGCGNLVELSINSEDTAIDTDAILNETDGMPGIADACRVICWPDSDAERLANQYGLTVKYFKEKADDAGSTLPDHAAVVLPPPVIFPVVSSYEEYTRLPYAQNKTADMPDMPIFIQTPEESANTELRDSSGAKYKGEYFIRTEVKSMDNKVVTVDISAYDIYGDKLHLNGNATILLTYDDIERWLGVRQDDVIRHNITICHEYERGKFEYFSISDHTAAMTSHSLEFHIDALSPFTIYSELDATNAESLPSTGDSSMLGVWLLLLLGAMAAFACMLWRRHA